MRGDGGQRTEANSARLPDVIVVQQENLMALRGQPAVLEVRAQLVEIAGRTTQDLGLGRIVGQVLGAIYLAERECSLDEVGETLGLSKAAVSIATRQLEGLGLLHRVWKKGDRKSYYRTVDNFGTALRQGILTLVRNKARAIGSELDRAEELLKGLGNGGQSKEARLLRKRVKRAKNLRKRATQILESPLLRLLGR